MSWTVWDVLVVLAGLANLGVLVALGVAAMKIVRGPVAWANRRRQTITVHVTSLAQSGKAAFFANRDAVTELATEVTGLRGSLHADSFRTPFADEAVSYGRIAVALATARQVRSGWAMFANFRKGGFKSLLPSAGRKAPARPAKPNRFGLVPPILVTLMPVVRVARTAFGVHKQLRSKGLLP